MPLLENLLPQGTVERLGWMLVHCLWQATAVALLLAGVLRLLRKSGANLRYVVSCLALTLMVVLPMLTIQFLSGAGSVAEPDPVLIIQPPAAPSPVLTAQAVAEISPLAEPPAGLEPPAPPALSWREGIVSTLKPALPYVVFGWLLGVFGLSAWHLGGWAQLQCIKRRMVQQGGPALRNKVADLGTRLGVRRGVALLESALVEVPTVVGWIRPAILLPASALTGLSPDQLEAILAHELAHIRRYDYLVNVLQTVVEILGFYHPAVWWVSRRIRVERENCCDDLAVRVCGDSLQYAKALTCMEEIRHRRTEWAVAATGGSLFARIARVLGRPAVDDRRFAWLPGLLTLALITALLIPTAFVLGAAGPQQTNDSSNGMAVEDANTGSDLPEAQQDDNVRVQVQTDANDVDAASAAEKASVLLEFTIAKVLNDATLDRETTLQVLNILGETTQTTAPDATQPLTAQEVLKKYVVGRQLPPETAQALLDLLRSRGYVQIEANPQVMTRDSTEANIRIGTEVPIPVPAKNGDSSQTTMENVECGTAIRVTPHVDKPDVVTLEIAVELTGVLPNPPGEETPRVCRRALESTLTLQTDRYFSLLMEPQLDEANETPDEAPVLVMVKPSIPEPQAAHVTEEGGTPKHSANVRRRQVLLDARVVTVERGNLLNLGVEWAWPKPYAGFSYDSTGNGDVGSNKALPRGPMTGIRLGYTSGPEFTDSLLAALDLLQENGQADILSSPRILGQDGRQAQLKVVTEEYFVKTPPAPGESSPVVWELQKVETGTTLTVTPWVDDHNNITLEMAIEVSDSIPNRGGRGLPVVTRRIAKNAVTIENGGTVALAGLMENRSRSQGMRVPVLSDLPLLGALFRTSNKDTTPREVAVFVTAHLVDNREDDGLSPSEPSEATVHLPLPDTRAEQGKEEPKSAPVITTNLFDVFATLSSRTGSEIVSDATVKPIRVVVDFDVMSLPVGEALQRVLQGTEYKTDLLADGTCFVYRPITCTYAGQDLGDVLRELSTMTGVPIVPDRPATGPVYADIHGLPLEKGLATILSGTPWSMRRMLEVYQLTANPMVAASWQGMEDMSPGRRWGRGKLKSPPLPANMTLIDALSMLRGDRARILIDGTVKPVPIVLDFDPTNMLVPEALQRILQGTDYRFRIVGDNVYAVYRPNTCLFAGRDLREALWELSELAGVPIIPDVNVTGRVSADIRDQPLEKALEILLAGTPYVVTKTPDYYLVADWRQGTLSPFDRETRDIHLTRITAERAKRLVPTDMAPYVTVEAVDPNNRRHILITAPHSLVDRIVADIQRVDTRPRQVLLDVRVATMKRPDLLDLGIEWGGPTLATNDPSDKGGIQVGYARDRTSTHSLLAGLNRLTENRRAELVAAPQLVAQDGQPSQVPPLVYETRYYMMGESRTEQGTKLTELQRIDGGAFLSITPHVGDHNDITLEISAAISDSRPNSQRGGPPIVVRRALKNTTTVNDGGTVVWAGRAKSGSEAKRTPGLDKLPLIGPLFRNNDKDKTPREIVIFVTARLADRLPTDSLPASQPAGTTIRIPPLPAREEQGKREPRNMATATTGNLIEILTNLSQRTGAKITTDATVKPTPVALDFDPIDMPVAKALQRILQDTDYRFRIVGDNAYLVYRPITCLYEGRNLREALQDLSVAAEVPIIPDPNVTGQVWADIREQPVGKALEIMLAGTPYVVKKTPDYYLVTDRRVVSFSPLDRETRSIHLTRITPERAKRLVPMDAAPYVTVEPVDPNNRGHVLITAPHSVVDRIVANIQNVDTRPRLLLLDARVIAIAHRDLLNLRIDWFGPTRQADTLADSAPGRDKKTQNGTIGGILVGYAQDRASTESLLAGLNQLLEDAQAEPIGSPQILAQDGRRCQLKLASEAWQFVPDSLKSRYLMQRAELQKIDANTALFITPRVSDHDDVTLEMALEVRDRTPQDQSSDLPAVMRRVAENVVTIADGGTVVWAGLGESRLGQKKPTPPPGDLPLLGALFRKHGKDEPPREVVVFVTVHLVRDVPAANAADGTRETRRIVASLEPRTE